MYSSLMNLGTKVVVVGGCGHVGLPLCAVLAEAGMSVVAYDTNQASVDSVNQKKAPFMESGLDQLLDRVVPENLVASASPKSIRDSHVVIMIVGTPLDVHLNPDPNSVVKALEGIMGELVNGQLLILRSTVFPGVTKRIEALLDTHKKKIDVAFCPERIAEGFALQELRMLPQIIGVRNQLLFEKTQNLFRHLGIKSIRTTPEEAEFAKLFTNTWRYIKFAAANQFWMLANSSDVDFEVISSAMKFEYPRASDLPGAGFAAGPCLFKDAMQLATFSGNDFPLGQAAMQINEGQPNFIVSKLKESYDLTNMAVGILGMAFKGGSDDKRSSLAYKLKKTLKFSSRKVLTSDPFVKNDKELVSQEELLSDSDLVIIGAPHSNYRELEIAVPVVDIWNLRNNGSNIV
jgi:UDP-N-acetyl-D-mannosaminuronic acid dehydrogenase